MTEETVQISADELMAGYAAYASAEDLSIATDDGAPGFTPATISITTTLTSTPTWVTAC
ncbi:LxmA leader domain family RiPP [Micromonospora sp. NPDC023888]|uniref:LxmA leader domain family RiPP n=1 Tax=Micromonospora sp. NPDC023888 TaxID=3155607 RepID=UPI0033E5AE1F